MMKNIYYFQKISKIGGTEQFLYEIAKAYKDYDLTIYYSEAHPDQIKRLSKYLRCRKYIRGQKVKCERAFFNFNIDMIDDVEAEEYYFVIHATYSELGYKTPTHPKINHYIAVSDFAKRKFYEQEQIEATRIYNPLTLEPEEKVINLVSACRLEDECKGGIRTQKLIKALDNYCARTGRHYIWHIYTNSLDYKIQSPNVCLMQPRVDVRPFIQNADFVLQLSDDMETYCYTLNEAWSYGVHTVATPLSVIKELKVPKEANITLEFDCSNIDEVIEKIFEEPKPFTYQSPKSDWDKLLAKGSTTYNKDDNMKVKLLQDTLDTATGKILPTGTIMEVSNERGAKAIASGFAKEIVEEVKTEVKEPKAVKKAVRKTTNK